MGMQKHLPRHLVKRSLTIVPFNTSPVSQILTDNFTWKQECIPVRCVPLSCWPYPVVSDGGGVSSQPPWRLNPPSDADPPVIHAGKSPPPPCGQKEWHALVKIIPCPKLRLRAVTNLNSSAIISIEFIRDSIAVLSVFSFVGSKLSIFDEG